MNFIYTSMYKNRNGIKQMKGKQNSHDNIHEHSKLSKIPNERSKEEEKRGKENILLTQTLVLMVQHK